MNERACGPDRRVRAEATCRRAVLSEAAHSERNVAQMMEAFRAAIERQGLPPRAGPVHSDRRVLEGEAHTTSRAADLSGRS